MAKQVAQALVGEALDVELPLATQGLDSLAAMELRQKLQACCRLVLLKPSYDRFHSGTDKPGIACCIMRRYQYTYLLRRCQAYNDTGLHGSKHSLHSALVKINSSWLCVTCNVGAAGSGAHVPDRGPSERLSAHDRRRGARHAGQRAGWWARFALRTVVDLDRTIARKRQAAAVLPAVRRRSVGERLCQV